MDFMGVDLIDDGTLFIKNTISLFNGISIGQDVNWTALKSI